MGSTNRHATTTMTSHRGAVSGPGPPQPLPGLFGGDNAAFAQAYRTHLAALSAHVAARLTDGDLDLVADLVHDAFADALADPTLIGADVLVSLRRLCDRACTRYQWSQRRYLRAAHTIYADQRADQPPAQQTAQPGTVEALAALPDAERQVACLRILEGLTAQATARLLGRSVGRVTYLERRACHLLREQLTRPAAGPGATPAPATLTGRA